MNLFSRKRLSESDAPAAPAAPAKSKKAAPELTLEALGRKIDALSRRCEAAESANALALTVIAEMFRNPHAGPLGVRLEVAAQSAEFESAAAGIKALLGRIEKASTADSARQMRRASGRLNVVSGGNARNF
jgi:hypothetical protein